MHVCKSANCANLHGRFFSFFLPFFKHIHPVFVGRLHLYLTSCLRALLALSQHIPVLTNQPLYTSADARWRFHCHCRIDRHCGHMHTHLLTNCQNT